MTQPAAWHTIVEHDAPASPYVENLAERPGVGDCSRDDGRHGPLVELIPDGWRLIDFGCVVTDADGQHDRLYLSYGGGASCWREYASPSRRWRVVAGSLELDEVS